jgi:hypothetical protein
MFGTQLPGRNLVRAWPTPATKPAAIFILIGIDRNDAGLRRKTPSRNRNPPAPRLLGLVISPRTNSSFLGYERCDADAPMMLAAFLRWRHRGTFPAAWEDVARVGTELVRMRPGYTRCSAVLCSTD